ncbi:DUF3253 domain-containing protein [Sphingomicrobium clamense]|uniref:DUF3253 domain-containing protein n=1 Tax=Sphingomicrobium clamense TaxID=2851013 RepID=A0ABS6V398_9SPHN|nr:DUF3253 domain-containing protein [Sphingomicrobium sp. B8]MBW0144032.1 DUF3253 domain-containing protein [Sphingomicrobium sp. B8]
MDAREAILTLVAARDPDKTICPSEAARLLADDAGRADDWREWMEPVHAAARALVAEGRLEYRQQGEQVAAPDGAYRLGRRPRN